MPSIARRDDGAYDRTAGPARAEVALIPRLGGYLARANSPPPGNTVMWRGLSRLTDIALGAMIGAEFVGN